MLKKFFLNLAPDGAPAGGGVGVIDPPVNAPQPTATGTVDPPPPGSPADDAALYRSEIEGLDDDKPAAPTPPKPQSQTGKSEEQIEAEEQAAAEKAAKEKAQKPETKPPEQKSPEVPKKAKDLKMVYEEAKGRISNLERELTEHKTKVQELEKAAPVAEVQTLVKQLEAAQNRLREFETEAVTRDFQQSPDFQKNYVKPYQDAFRVAMEDLKEIDVLSEAGEPVRKATHEDLVQLMNMPLGEARKAANTLFGDLSNEVMNLRGQVRSKWNEYTAAIERSKSDAVEASEKKKAENLKLGEKIRDVWTQAVQDMLTKYPRWYRAIDGDEEGNAILVRGYQKADQFFSDKLPIEEMVKLRAEIRGKFANHDRLALRYKRAMGELKKAKGELEQYRASTPPSGGNGTGRAPVTRLGDKEQTEVEIQALDDGT